MCMLSINSSKGKCEYSKNNTKKEKNQIKALVGKILKITKDNRIRKNSNNINNTKTLTKIESHYQRTGKGKDQK